MLWMWCVIFKKKGQEKPSYNSHAYKAGFNEIIKKAITSQQATTKALHLILIFEYIVMVSFEN